HDGATSMHTLADGDVEVLDRLRLEGLEHRRERLFRELLALLPEGFLHDRLAEIEVLLALLRADEAADGRSGLARDHEALPGRRRRLRLGGHDVDLIAVLQRSAQRHQPAIDLGTD